MNYLLTEHVHASGQRLQLVQGDITQEEVGAIVNAANARLRHRGGVAGVISHKGGSVIQAESDTWVKGHGPVRHDSPAYTSGGDLPCRYVIHAVGPVWGAGDEDAKLSEAITGSLRLADQLHVESIAIPAISTGIFGFPKERAARITFATIQDYFENNPTSGLTLVRVLLYDSPTVTTFLNVWQSMKSGDSR